MVWFSKIEKTNKKAQQKSFAMKFLLNIKSSKSFIKSFGLFH